MIILGLVGEKGSGKETFTKLLIELLPQKRVNVISTTELMSKTLDLWDITKTRENLQQIAILMELSFGEGSLNKALVSQVQKANADIVVWDSVRFINTAKFVKGLENAFLVYITAPVKIRFKRIKQRKQKVDEEMVSFKEFVNNEEIATEKDIPVIGRTADYRLENSASLEDFKQQIQNLCRQIFV